MSRESTFREHALLRHAITASLTYHSYQRGKRNTNPGTSLLKLEGVDSTEAANWYAGKRVACMYN
jgi:large subunit ribosomal protein L35Ae